MLGLAHRGFALHDYRQHLIHTLRKVGYASTLIGVQHVAADAVQIGYDRVVELPDHSGGSVAGAAVRFLREVPAQPFFLSVGFSETHRDYPNVNERASRYVLPPAPLPDTPQTRQDMAAYVASAQILDEGVGAILAALDDAGLAENTLVLYTTDHGIAFPGMKCNLTGHGIGVALILPRPRRFFGRAGLRCAGLTH